MYWPIVRIHVNSFDSAGITLFASWFILKSIRTNSKLKVFSSISFFYTEQLGLGCLTRQSDFRIEHWSSNRVPLDFFYSAQASSEVLARRRPLIGSRRGKDDLGRWAGAKPRTRTRSFVLLLRPSLGGSVAPRPPKMTQIETILSSSIWRESWGGKGRPSSPSLIEGKWLKGFPRWVAPAGRKDPISRGRPEALSSTKRKRRGNEN